MKLEAKQRLLAADNAKEEHACAVLAAMTACHLAERAVQKASALRASGDTSISRQSKNLLEDADRDLTNVRGIYQHAVADLARDGNFNINEMQKDALKLLKSFRIV